MVFFKAMEMESKKRFNCFILPNSFYKWLQMIFNGLIFNPATDVWGLYICSPHSKQVESMLATLPAIFF